jgi:NADH-quinone oxidoreductase subunit A
VTASGASPAGRECVAPNQGAAAIGASLKPAPGLTGGGAPDTISGCWTRAWRVFYYDLLCDKIHKVRAIGRFAIMDQAVLPIFLFAGCATVLVLGLLGVSSLIGPSSNSRVKEMPYESGMDPIHDARRRFDVRFYLVAIAFLVFDVELLFLYPWAVASGNPEGIDRAVANHWVESRALVFTEVISFILLLGAGYLYAWRKGVFQWR